METKKIIIISVVGLLVVAGGVVAFILMRKKANTPAVSTPAVQGNQSNTSVQGNNNPGYSYPPAAPIKSRYPTKAQMLAAVTAQGNKQGERAFLGGQRQGSDRNFYEAIDATYNENDGTFVRGDWRGVVVSKTPITFKNFKGSGENFQVETPLSV